MKKSTFYGLISILLAAAIVIACGVGSSWFTNGNFKTWFNSWGAGTEDKLPSDNVKDSGPSGTIITGVEENGVQLMSERLLPSDYAVFGVSDNVQDAFSLTAKVLPAGATDTRLIWTVNFLNPASAWAKGKSATDFVTVDYGTVTMEASHSAVLKVYDAFGEPIILTVKSAADETKFSTKQIDYAKRISKINVFDGVSDTASGGFEIYAPDDVLCTEYTVGTVENIYDFTLTGEMYYRLDFSGGYGLEDFNNGMNAIAQKYGKTFNYDGGYYYTDDEAPFDEMFSSNDDGKVYGLGDNGFCIPVSVYSVLYCSDRNYSYTEAMKAEVLRYLYDVIADDYYIILELCCKYNYAIGFSNPNVDEDIYIDGMTTKQIVLTKEFFYTAVTSVSFNQGGNFLV